MLLYIIYRIAQVIVSILPIGISFWIFERLADLHYYTSKRDRSIIGNNLRNVIGNDRAQIDRTIRTVMQSFARYIVEFIRLQRVTPDYIKRYIEVEGIENLKSALKSGKGVIALSAHMGNWEWAGAVVAQLGFPTSAIVMTHKHKKVNDFFVRQRGANGVTGIPLGGSVRNTIKALARNEVIGILSDRDFTGRSTPVQLFKKTAYLPIGVGLLAAKTSCSIVPMFLIRQKGANHKYIIDRPIEYKLTGDRDKDIRDVMQKCASAIERIVKRYPCQWFMLGNPWERP